MQDQSSGDDPLISIEIEHEASGSSADPPHPSTDSRPLILIADDDVATCIFLKRVLGSFACDLVEAHDGNVALALFNAHAERISLVVLDVIMPGMDGERVLDAIREHDPEVKVLMISSETDPDQRQELLKHGATAFLSKPLDTISLAAAARRLLPAELVTAS